MSGIKIIKDKLKNLTPIVGRPRPGPKPRLRSAKELASLTPTPGSGFPSQTKSLENGFGAYRENVRKFPSEFLSSSSNKLLKKIYR
jgi:hypothetical protein